MFPMVYLSGNDIIIYFQGSLVIIFHQKADHIIYLQKNILPPGRSTGNSLLSG